MKRLLLLSILLAGILLPSFAQLAAVDKKENVTSVATDNPDSVLELQRSRLAMGSADYKVTAGDIYTLAFAAGSIPMTYAISVDTTYKIRVGNMAVIDAAGKTYIQLKEQVESIVTRNYPLSGVQFVLSSPGVFQVQIRGEVTAALTQTAWGLTRLSEVLQTSLTEYSSTRDIKITSTNGKVRICDLFKYYRFGSTEDNPYLRPDDVISIQRLQRSVTLEGEVERPGTYQLLPGENLKELIEYYGSNLTVFADPSRIKLIRFLETTNPSGESIELAETDISENYEVRNKDIIRILSRKELLPVMFIEGAIGPIDGLLTSSNKLNVNFNPGENLANIIREARAQFSAVSDTANAYLLRGSEKIPVNLNPMLYDASYRSTINVQDNDMLIVPFRQYFVTVSGAVNAPGRYPYIPDRDWEYYIALAGGFNPERNANESIVIKDIHGKKQDKNQAVTPESIIHANTNAFMYYFNRYAPALTTTLTIATTFITILIYTGIIPN